MNRPEGEVMATVLFEKMHAFEAAAKWLEHHPECTGKIGAVGFCFGGGVVNSLAVRLPELGAAAPFASLEARK